MILSNVEGPFVWPLCSSHLICSTLVQATRYVGNLSKSLGTETSILMFKCCSSKCFHYMSTFSTRIWICKMYNYPWWIWSRDKVHWICSFWHWLYVWMWIHLQHVSLHQQSNIEACFFCLWCFSLSLSFLLPLCICDGQNVTVV